MTGCSPPKPLRIGIISGISDRTYQPISFDGFGDTPRPVFFAEIRAGQFVSVM